MNQTEMLLENARDDIDRRLGKFDVLLAPAGAQPFEDLMQDSLVVPLDDGRQVRIASLDDLIAMKKAAGRNKDLLAIPILEYLRDRKEHPVD